MLNAIGHPEWIVKTEQEYIDKVIALARDVELRKTLRATPTKPDVGKSLVRCTWVDGCVGDGVL
ncbi:MAG: hypothetical protein WDM70_06125 [Nitrosomonadales bacterium]